MLSFATGAQFYYAGLASLQHMAWLYRPIKKEITVYDLFGWWSQKRESQELLF